jgi:hypothetical protein
LVQSAPTASSQSELQNTSAVRVLRTGSSINSTTPNPAQGSGWRGRSSAFLPNASAGSSVMQTSQGNSGQFSKTSQTLGLQQPTDLPPSGKGSRFNSHAAENAPHNYGIGSAFRSRRRPGDAQAKARITQTALLHAYGGASGQPRRSLAKLSARPISAAAVMSASHQQLEQGGDKSGGDKMSSNSSGYRVRQVQRSRMEARSGSQVRRERAGLRRGVLGASSRL